MHVEQGVLSVEWVRVHVEQGARNVEWVLAESQGAVQM